MARLREESDDEFPDLVDIIKKHRQASSASTTADESGRQCSQNRKGSRTRIPAQRCWDKAGTDVSSESDATASAGLIPKIPQTEVRARRQRPLKNCRSANPILRPLFLTTPGKPVEAVKEERTLRLDGTVKQTPRQTVKKAINYGIAEDFSIISDADSHESSRSGSEESEDHDSIAEIEFWTRPGPTPARKRTPPLEDTHEPSRLRRSPTKQVPKQASVQLETISDLTTPQPPRDVSCLKLLQQPSFLSIVAERPSSSSDNDRKAILTFNPPKLKSPRKAAPTSRPVTPPPPASPPKSGLLSPSKRSRIPTPPHRPSIDAFWSQSVINEWNDQYSPRKTLTSPRKRRPLQTLVGSDDEFPSPSASPRKSPVKRDRVAVEARKAFEARKHTVAEEFLSELDERITKGKIAELAAETGGVKIVWSKKLNSTAGRANWKREGVRTRGEDGKVETTYRHQASVELAEKVIDDEGRLINVLAHEFCHLANFMISGIKNNPHGKEFKEWGRKCSVIFGHRGVEVTTKHSYAIDYKYVWECVSCRHEYKRHSKSIDPARHTCGGCKSKLIQTKPAVRSAKASEYQLFVKEHFQRVKKENPGTGHAIVMETLGKMYRERKARNSGEGDGKTDVDQIVRALDVIILDD